jgi:hypothetical protein
VENNESLTYGGYGDYGDRRTRNERNETTQVPDHTIQKFGQGTTQLQILLLPKAYPYLLLLILA